ncbi:unnamed protein product, partial [Discosporangium mesarthrocarpum]
MEGVNTMQDLASSTLASPRSSSLSLSPHRLCGALEHQAPWMRMDHHLWGEEINDGGTFCCDDGGVQDWAWKGQGWHGAVLAQRLGGAGPLAAIALAPAVQEFLSEGEQVVLREVRRAWAIFPATKAGVEVFTGGGLWQLM